MKNIILVFLSIASMVTHSQTTTFKWAKQAGSFSQDGGFSIAIDSNGSVYTVGDFTNTIDFGHGSGAFHLTSAGSSDVFVSKHDASGSILWAKGLGGFSSDNPVSLSLDQDANIFVVGYFAGLSDFDPGAGSFILTSKGSNDIFIFKLDSNGNFLWAQQLGGNHYDLGFAIALDENNNVYTTGSFEDTADFDPGAGTHHFISKGNQDIFINKLDNDGHYIWTKQFGGVGLDRGYTIVSDSVGNVYSSGFFSHTVDFDPGIGTFNLTSNGLTDVFLLKLDSNGNFVWAKQWGGPLTEIGKPISIDQLGNIYATGTFQDTIDIDPGPGVININSKGSSDIYISKFDPNGNLLWIKQIGDTLYDNVRSAVLDEFNNIYLTGYFHGTVDFDPGAGIFDLSTAGDADIHICKLNPNGDFIWAKQMGSSPFNDEAYYIAVDKFMNVYTTGEFQQTVDFDLEAGTFELTSAGNDDIFIHKMNQCYTKAPPISISTCYPYLWHGNTYTSSGTYLDTILNVAGCDSLMTLKLKINSTDSNLNILACDSFSWAGKTFFSSETIIDTLLNAAGCDSIVTLNLIIKKSTSSISHANVCYSYSWRGDNLTSTGIYRDTIPNSVGCDSIITLNLKVNEATSSITDITSCDSFLWLDHTITSSGSYFDTLSNSAGCDSILTLNATINKSSLYIENITACNSYTWMGNFYTSSGTYFDTLTNFEGCDSILRLNLIITDLNATLRAETPFLIANHPDGKYQWLDCSNNKHPISGETNQKMHIITLGSFAVEVTKGLCIDTSACYAVSDVDFLDNLEDLRPVIKPNPTRGSVIISFERELQNATINIMNSIGQLIYKDSGFNDQSKKIELQNFAGGLYILEVRENEKYLRSKIIKQ